LRASFNDGVAFGSSISGAILRRQFLLDFGECPLHPSFLQLPYSRVIEHRHFESVRAPFEVQVLSLYHFLECFRVACEPDEMAKHFQGHSIALGRALA
jgi:hypothetical protein